MSDTSHPLLRVPTRLLYSPAARSVVALLLILALGAIFHHRGAFFRPETHKAALRQTAEYGMMACGMTLVIISGGIDLAVGSILALSAVLFSLATIHWGWPAWYAVPATLAVGAGCGLVSGTLTAWCRMQPFIATLAMMVIARGLAKALSGGTQVTTAVRNPDGTYDWVDVPGVFYTLKAEIGGAVSMIGVLFLICAAVTWLLLARHRWGRELYAIGGNEEAARLSGVRVVRAKVLAYVASGILAAVAGMCHAAQEEQGNPDAGEGYELIAISMVVIGGTSLMGGRGGIGLTLLGILTIGYLDKILSINEVPLAWRLMLTGAIIVVAVLAQRRSG